jgi:predicted mannosyl-3-phosphoglycerate phosphatase (HAD superfamily)
MLAENGALIAVDDGWMGIDHGQRVVVEDRALRIIPLGIPAAALLSLLQQAAGQLEIRFRTQAEVLLSRRSSHARAARLAMARALERTHSLLIELDDPLGIDPLSDELARHDVRVSSGGHWIGVVGGSDKGDGLRALLAAVRVHQPWDPVIIGIGNKRNDVSLLTAADQRFVVRDAFGDVDPLLSSLPGVVVLDLSGVSGWMEMLERMGIGSMAGAP